MLQALYCLAVCRALDLVTECCPHVDTEAQGQNPPSRLERGRAGMGTKASQCSCEASCMPPAPGSLAGRTLRLRCREGQETARMALKQLADRTQLWTPRVPLGRSRRCPQGHLITCSLMPGVSRLDGGGGWVNGDITSFPLEMCEATADTPILPSDLYPSDLCCGTLGKSLSLPWERETGSH